jgi:hypothetical protein
VPLNFLEASHPILNAPTGVNQDIGINYHHVGHRISPFAFAQTPHPTGAIAEILTIAPNANEGFTSQPLLPARILPAGQTSMTRLQELYEVKDFLLSFPGKVGKEL